VQAALGGFLLFLALAAWLAYRLKQKNSQLKKALATLQRRRKEPAPIIPTETTSPARAPKFDQGPMADAFLWQHLREDRPVPFEQARDDSHPIPTGTCDEASLQPMLDCPFAGLVVLVGIVNIHTLRPGHMAQPFLEELRGPADCVCRHGDDEFLIVCPGLRGAIAQRRLTEISERLWSFQQSG